MGGHDDHNGGCAVRLEKAVKQELKAESCIEGIYAELHRYKKSSKWLHRRVTECMKRMHGYPRHSQSHVHGFSHGMFMHFMRFHLIYAAKFPCGTLVSNSKDAEVLGVGPREMTLKPYMTGHYWPDEDGFADKKHPFKEQVSTSLTEEDGALVTGESYVVMGTADNGVGRDRPWMLRGPMYFWDAVEYVGEQDPFKARPNPYKIDGEVYPYMYIVKASDSIVFGVQKSG